jgi:uncharacterized protein (TIGR00290 family)
MRAFASWSGGKDSCLSYYLAAESGLKIRCLMNILNEDGDYSCTHGLPWKLLHEQALAIGLPLVQMNTNGARYESDFKKMLVNFKEKGIEGGIFGNGDVERKWIDSVCREVGITPYLPLEGLSKEKIINEFIAKGFEAIVVTARATILGEEWLGRKLDEQFLEDWAKLRKEKNITPLGVSGAFHTMVIDGPIFKKRLEIVESNSVLRDGFWFLEVKKTKQVKKVTEPTAS